MAKDVRCDIPVQSGEEACSSESTPLFQEELSKIFDRPIRRETAPSTEMRHKAIGNGRRRPAFVCLGLPLTSSVHYAAIKIEPAAFRIDSPTHVENGFVSCAGIEPNENEEVWLRRLSISG